MQSKYVKKNKVLKLTNNRCVLVVMSPFLYQFFWSQNYRLHSSVRLIATIRITFSQLYRLFSCGYFDDKLSAWPIAFLRHFVAPCTIPTWQSMETPCIHPLTATACMRDTDATDTRKVSGSSSVPSEVAGSAWSHRPLSLLAAANKRALAVWICIGLLSLRLSDVSAFFWAGSVK